MKIYRPSYVVEVVCLASKVKMPVYKSHILKNAIDVAGSLNFIFKHNPGHFSIDMKKINYLESLESSPKRELQLIQK